MPEFDRLIMKMFLLPLLSAPLVVILVASCDSPKPPRGAVNPIPEVSGVPEKVRALSSKYPAETVNLLLSRMQAELPKGWRATYEKETSVLEITRDELIIAENVIINGPPDWKPPGRDFKFTFALRALPFVAPDDFRRLNAENARIQKEISALYEDLVRKRIPYKFDRFVGESEEQKAAVARYEALRNSRHDLPRFYSRNLSLEWVYGWLDNSVSGNADVAIYDAKEREECTRVQKKILALLSRYEDA
jgi:hypothetical protein